MKRIDKLTPEQEAQLPVYRDKWLKIGLCTDPANKEEAEKWIDEAYKIIGYKPASQKFWVSSPKAGAVKAGELLGTTPQQALDNTVYSQHEAGWLSFYDFMIFLGFDECEKLIPLMNVAQNCGWWWPMDEAVVISDRPESIHRDDRGRLHNPDGAAIMYRDGWGVYAVHGVRIPKWIITEPNSITPEKIEKERNAEIRRVMLDKFGWDKYLMTGGAECIDKSELGELWRKEIADDEPLVMVRLVDSTPKYNGFGKEDIPEGPDRKRIMRELQEQHPEAFATYLERVPPDMKTVKQALCWQASTEQHAIEEKDYVMGDET